MSNIDWEAVERLLQPLHPSDPLHDWAVANRMSKNVTWLGDGLDPFDPDRARLLCWFDGLRSMAKDPSQRAPWMRPLRDAGVSLETQTWLWIALERFMESPVTCEEHAAHDARGLERVGALGVVRAFMRGGRDETAMADVLAVVRKNLDGAVFITPAGRRIGVRRVVVARRFLQDLEEE